MSTEPKPALPDGASFPEAIKLRRHKFGANPTSELVCTAVGGDSAPGTVP